MSVSRLSAAFLVVSTLALLAPSALAGGPEVFTASKCTKCHSVAVAGIPAASKPLQRDLSAVGAKRDAAWLTSFIEKEVGLPSAKDPATTALHKFAWKGEDADLATLVSWLAEQKTAAPGAPAGEEAGEGEGEGGEGAEGTEGAEGAEVKAPVVTLPEPVVDPAKKAAGEVAAATRAAEKQAAYVGTAAATPAASPAPAPAPKEDKGGCSGAGSLPAAWALFALMGLALGRRRARR